MNPFEIFRSGCHTPSQGGAALTFTEADLASIASGYDPALHEAPLVVGHPSSDAPAYGWVRALSTSDGVLVATVDQVHPEFAELVRRGRFKKRSASFYRPDAPANPRPGSWYLRHVGFLGAQPPAVKGLRDVAFSDGADSVVTVEFGEADADGDARLLARLVAGLRRLLSDDAAFVERHDRADNDTATTPTIPTTTTTKEDPVADDNQAREAELAAREEQLRQREAAFAEAAEAAARQRAETARADNRAFLARLVSEGRPLPAPEEALLDFMDGLDGGSVAFAEGGGEVRQVPALQFFRDQVLARLPRQVDFRERSGGAVPDDNPEAIAAAAIAFQEEEARSRGRTVDIATAVRAVVASRA